MDTPREDGPSWIADVLSFWFDEIAPERWYHADAAFDATVRARFLDVHRRLATTVDPTAPGDAARSLASVIALDQFPRNMFRGSAGAFATDHLALDVARTMVDRGIDREIAAERRIFVYLPFEHSETLADQDRCVELVARLENLEWLDYARRHWDIIARFGRFPHRNAVLDRASTPDELAFLQQPGSSF